MNFKDEIKKYIHIVEKELDKVIPKEDCFQAIVCEAMRYSIFAGGKRIRPILTLKAFELVSKDNYEEALPFASAIEMIHTYSLIHDDLPAMDNDDIRRGKPTNHKKYGEDIAILAGDGLLNLAYETMINSLEENTENISGYIKAMKEISNASGVYGMIGGQVVDIMSDKFIMNEEQLNFIHRKKTSALIEASIMSGGFLANGSSDEMNALRSYGQAIGLCFQIRDDILDKIGDNKKLGKDVGSDEVNNKLTYLTLYGMDNSIKKTHDLCQEAISSLDIFDDKHTVFFKELAQYLVCRES